MSNLNFDELKLRELNKQQLNKFGKYVTAMYLAGLGLDIETKTVGKSTFLDVTIVDQQHIDVYVRTGRLKKGITYSFIRKSSWENQLRSNCFVSLLLIDDDNSLNLYLIPALVWKTPNSLFVDRDYSKEGQVSVPEWGVSVNQSNFALLKDYDINKQLLQLALK